MNLMDTVTEAFDGEDVVGGFRPRLGVFVVSFDEGANVGFQLAGRGVHAAMRALGGLVLAALVLALAALPFASLAAAAQSGAPAVTGVSITSNPASGDAYAAGETITADVTFDQVLTVTGAPNLAIAVGATTRQAAGSHTSGESKIAFSYTVATADKDIDGIAIAAGALTLNGGTIRNVRGEDARLGLGSHALAAQASHKVSAPPRVTDVVVRKPNLRAGNDGETQFVPLTSADTDPRQTATNRFPPSIALVNVIFDQPVTISGTPQLALAIGAHTRQATYSADFNDNPAVVPFYYSLQASDFDGDGISVVANALALNGGTIRDAEGEDAMLGLGSHAISNDATLRVADTAPSFPATLEARRYLLNLRVSDQFPAATGGDGTPTFSISPALPAGLSWDAAMRTISGTPTSATAAASYTLAATDGDGDAATLTFDLSVVTDPVVSGLSITSSPASGDAYAAGETIAVDLIFDQTVTVTGRPNLALTIGGTARQATGSHVSGQSKITFRYTVATSDRDTDGISIAAAALTPNGATIRNAKGEDARLGLGSHAVVGAAGHKVSAPPRVVEVRLDSMDLVHRPPGDSWDTQPSGWADPRQTATNRFAPAVVIAMVAFDQDVVFGGSGRPSLALTIGGQTRQAANSAYLDRRFAQARGRSASQVLGFHYTLQPSDFDGDGISIAAGALTLPVGTTLRDAEGEAALLGLGTHAIANDPNYRVRDTAPSFGAATIQPQHWVAGTASSLTLPAATGDGSVSHALTPVRRPSWLAFDGATRVLSGTPPAAAVAANTFSKNFRKLWKSPLSGTPPAAAAAATHTWTATDGDGESTALAFTLTVAAANAPKVSEVKILSTPAAHRMYAPGSAIKVGVKFDKAVTVTGAPTLALDIGGTTRKAGYGATRNGYLVFSHTVLQADYDTDGVSIGSGALALPADGSGDIVDAADASVRAALGLGSHAIADAAGHRAGSPPRVTGVSFHSTPQQAGAYTMGATITVQVDFDQTVTVTGTPQLALTISGQTRQAAAVAGTGNAYVRFSYPVAAADADADGLGVAAGALTLDGGTIRDADGQDAVLALGSHARTAFANAKVNGGRTGLWPDFGSAAGPDLALTVGTAATHALPTATGGDTPLRYTVSPALPAGLSVNASTGVLSGTPGMEIPRTAYTLTATDANGDTATLSFHLKVTGARPVVSGVAVASTPLSGDTYGASEEIRVDVAFVRSGTGAMMVRGHPRLALKVGGATRLASFLSVSGGTLRFRYTAQAEDRDTDGIAIAAGALDLNGGLIRDAAGNNAILSLGSHALGAQVSHKVDGSTGRAPAVTGVSVISAPTSGDTYTRGETIEVELRFDQAVGVSGTPNLALTLGSATAQAAWNRAGASPTTQVFRHVVAAVDRDTDGLSIAAGALTLNGGTIRNVRGGDAGLGLGSRALGDQALHKVNGVRNTAAMVTGVSIQSFQRDGWYDHGETIDVRVTFNKAVTVTGSPQVALAIGDTTRQAVYRAASGASVDFRYTVADPDHDTDGLSIAAGALTLNSGTISNGDVAAALGLGSHALGAQAAHKVDGRAGSVTSVSIRSTPADSAGYGAGEKITVRVNFSDNVGTPQGSKLALTIGDNTRQASVRGEAEYDDDLWYDYTVQTTDRDTDGISIAANALTGSITRRAGNPINLVLGSSALGNQASHKVTGAVVTPRVTKIRANFPVRGDTYGFAERISVSLYFNVPVSMGGTAAQLDIAVGGTTHRLYGHNVNVFQSRINFGHQVEASDRDTDGISIATDALTLHSNGTLRSRLGVDAALGLPATIVNNSARKVDGSLNPAAEGSVSLRGTARHNIFLTNEKFRIYATYDRPVRLTGVPTIAMQVGSVARRASLTRASRDGLSRGRWQKSWVWEYTVRHDDRDPDGVSIAADALRLEGGSITGPGGKAVRLRFTNSITNDARFRVGGAALPTPTFGAAVVPAQKWVVGSPWALTLPPATDGNGTLTYSLTGPGTSATTLSLPPGLSYSASSAGAFSGGRIAARRRATGEAPTG